MNEYYLNDFDSDMREREDDPFYDGLWWEID